MDECRWTRHRAASSSGGCTEYVRDVRSRPVPFCVLQGGVGGAAEKSASSGNIDPPADTSPRCCRRAMAVNPKDRSNFETQLFPLCLSHLALEHTSPAGTLMRT